MLAVADDQHPFAGPFAHHEFEPRVRGINGDERDCAIVVLARRYSALPLTEIECGYSIFLQQGNLTEFFTLIAARQPGHKLRVSGHHRSRPRFLKFWSSIS